MELFMPNKLKRNHVFKNITGKDLLHTAILSVISIFIIYLFVSLTVTGTSNVMLLTIFPSAFSIILIFSLHIRLDSNLNMIDYLVCIFKFFKMQKYYPFKKNKEW